MCRLLLNTRICRRNAHQVDRHQLGLHFESHGQSDDSVTCMIYAIINNSVVSRANLGSFQNKLATKLSAPCLAT